MMQCKTLTGKAYAKINLSLDIISKMDDGYHYLKTVMQTVGLCDEITVTCNEGSGVRNEELNKRNFVNNITINTNIPYVPNDDKNIAVKAAAAFYEHTGITGYDTKIQINKEIPVCAGLAGGSADAACVLRLLDEMHGTSLGWETLEKLGYKLGADVPFCLRGGTKLAEGRGEILTKLPPVPGCYAVICKPGFSFSTPELFRRIVLKDIRTRPDTAGLIKAVNNSDIADIARYMYNVFEDFLPRGKDDIEKIKSMLLEHGALGAVMTGSGPTVFGLFDDESFASKAHTELAKSYKDCFLTEINNPD